MVLEILPHPSLSLPAQACVQCHVGVGHGPTF